MTYNFKIFLSNDCDFLIFCFYDKMDNFLYFSGLRTIELIPNLECLISVDNFELTVRKLIVVVKLHFEIININFMGFQQ